MGRDELELRASSDPALDWGVATAPLAGESASGDTHVVRAFPAGVLVAVIDALGHGAGAAQAARLAADTLAQYAAEPPEELVHRCNHVLRGTRGVVMSLASIDWREHVMTWIGVGDVAGVLMAVPAPGATARLETTLLTRGGIVGAGDTPPARPWKIPLVAGDTLIFATDGIRRDFTAGGTTMRAPQAMAEELLRKYQKGTDDALVLVARYPRETR